jgi:crotonobetainyl-CoA:carnitine CoA-transferase CaiB-like acyl-CoA transferase
VIAHERAREASGVSPIAGLKVFDFTHVFAGPFCTRTLADLGADVVHVESPSRDPGDRHRATYAHRNKRSIALDLKSEAGHAVATRLAMGADVIVENFSAGVMRRLKLDYETLSRDNPRLIYISLSGYGHTGPRKSWTSMNMNLQAYTGLMLTTGAEGDPPTAISNSWNDYIGGLHGIIAVLGALTEREETGRGRNIDLSQFECSVATVGALLMASAVSGRPPKRWGNRSSSAAPQGAYPCGGNDEWCVIVAETDEQWLALAKAIGRPDLAADERFASVVGRMRHHDELDAAIEAWTRGRLNTDVERQLQVAGIPAERMRRVDDVVESPDSGGAYRPVPGERKKPLVAPSVPFTFSKSTVEAFTAPCALGEHTEEVLRDWLGLDAAEIASLRSRNAFGAERTN